MLRFRALGVLAVETAVAVLAGAAAFLLRFDLTLPAVWRPLLWAALGVWIPIKWLTIAALGMHRSSWRYISVRDALALGVGSAISGSVSAVVVMTALTGFPRSVCVLYPLLNLLLSAGVRFSTRFLFEMRRPITSNDRRKRTFIYGAGHAGVVLLREIRNDAALSYDIKGFVDDRVEKRGVVIHGVRVLGPGSELRALAQAYDVRMVLIAIRSASGDDMTRILRSCETAGVAYKIVPAISEIVEGKGLARQIRDVAVEDLLGRPPVRLDQDRIREKLKGRVILVTGAGGSIGSELCRQIGRFGVARIVGFDIAETALFHVQQEVAWRFPRVRFDAEIGSVQSERRLAEVFTQHRPSIVYHAAAYKHVPLMEAHVFEAVENNIIGTLNVARAAAAHGVGDFVMISSDKAVHPTSVMGVTKRIAELIIRGLPASHTKFVSVRFGNVLGSNGSVVPIFKEQISRGGPVTVTHPDMRRYFMTIPEASQLVLQASTMGAGGEIFVLEMGDPVPIVELARKLIRLSGLMPEQDIRIEFSSPRAGEKLNEELNTLAEHTLPTPHEKIKTFAGATIRPELLETGLVRLCACCLRRDFHQLIRVFKELVPDYRPSALLEDRAADRVADRPAIPDEREASIAAGLATLSDHVAHAHTVSFRSETEHVRI